MRHLFKQVRIHKMLEIIDEMLLRGFKKEYLTEYLILRYNPTELADALITIRKNVLESFAE
ncbi:MAG: hypothetical protein ACTSYM_06130 [Candidatus Baldrarchaeia archaeon]